MKAIVRTTRITPKKANLVAGMIRKRNADEALEILKYTPKKAAKKINAPKKAVVRKVKK